MPPNIYYHQKIETLEKELTALFHKKSLLAWLRFATVALAGMAFYLLFSFGIGYSVFSAIIFIALFIRLIVVDIKNKSTLQHTQFLVQICSDELKALDHNYFHFENGSSFEPSAHPYANDLDIFGRASIFQFSNRTATEMGAATLASWLLQPATLPVILQRQEAIKELENKTGWRLELHAFGKEQKITIATQNRLQDWLQSPPIFIHNSLWKIIQYGVPSIMLIVLILNTIGSIADSTRNVFLLAASIIAYISAKKITPMHLQVSKMADELAVLSKSVYLIENTVFNASLLQDLQSRFVLQNTKASTQLKLLKKIVERLDLRLNPVVFIPLAVIFQWDIQQGIALENWKKRNRKNITDWFEALGQLEALNSFSGLSFNHPEWCFPSFTENYFSISATQVGHPLINTTKRVDNPIIMKSRQELMLITGSNMAGKSTYLRSIGVNTVLAMAGAPVCAATFILSPVQLISSMRISDNLEESTSTFYAELKKLKTIIERVNSGEKIFILLDEILRGTNSLDRHTGSVALVKQLIKHQAACIIATHDVALAKLITEYPDNILNYHFDVQVEKDELYFDYKLKEGICTSLNASILMKKIGIEL
jgi:hypothetical protein